MGVKSEKFDDQFQGKLDFGDNNTDCQIAPNELPETQVPARIRKKKLKSSKVLPRRIVIIPAVSYTHLTLPTNREV